MEVTSEKASFLSSRCMKWKLETGLYLMVSVYRRSHSVHQNVSDLQKAKKTTLKRDWKLKSEPVQLSQHRSDTFLVQ